MAGELCHLGAGQMKQSFRCSLTRVDRSLADNRSFVFVSVPR